MIMGGGGGGGAREVAGWLTVTNLVANFTILIAVLLTSTFTRCFFTLHLELITRTLINVHAYETHR